jgi:hypothetical protein
MEDDVGGVDRSADDGFEECEPMMGGTNDNLLSTSQTMLHRSRRRKNWSSSNIGLTSS